jgi:AcrR family transcriptional regulator
MPRLWTETMETHRNAVRDATLDTTAALVAAHGLSAVTMSQIAKETGIGRATLYRYYPDVESILTAWHERQITSHLKQLIEIRNQAGTAAERLDAVLHAFAMISRHSHDAELAAVLHRGDHVVRAQRQLHQFIRDLIAENATARELRDDVPADELATYCLHALTSASNFTTKAAIHRLVNVTIAGLRPDRDATT